MERSTWNNSRSSRDSSKSIAAHSASGQRCGIGTARTTSGTLSVGGSGIGSASEVARRPPSHRGSRPALRSGVGASKCHARSHRAGPIFAPIVKADHLSALYQVRETGPIERDRHRTCLAGWWRALGGASSARSRATVIGFFANLGSFRRRFKAWCVWESCPAPCPCFLQQSVTGRGRVLVVGPRDAEISVVTGALLSSVNEGPLALLEGSTELGVPHSQGPCFRWSLIGASDPRALVFAAARATNTQLGIVLENSASTAALVDVLVAFRLVSWRYAKAEVSSRL